MTQQAFGFRSGYPTPDGFPLVFLSLSNADMVINSNGFTTTVSGGDWVEVGTDHPTLPRLGYVATTVVTGQVPFKRHDYTVTQNGTTYNGSAMSAPEGRGKDFSLFFNTCDSNYLFGSPENAGAYTYMKQFLEVGNTVLGIVHVDDHYGYVDNTDISDTGAGGTGHETTGRASDTELEYDYAMGYFGAFGLFVNDIGGAHDAWGQDKTRIWAMRNLNVIPQWGDHDAGGNEMGWLGGLPALRTGFINSQNLWNLIMKPLQPPSISNRATANHWAGTLGALTIVSPDAITLGSGNSTENHTTPDYFPGDIFTLNQIDDCLDALNNNSPFKIFPMANGIKYLDVGSKFFSGAQNPIKNAKSVEYERIFTKEDDTVNPLSVMANPNTNGMLGTFITMHGDYHTNKVQFNQAIATVGNHTENFYSFSVGTLNGSLNFGKNALFLPDYTFDGTTLESYTTSGFVNQNFGNDWYNMRIDIKDSTFPPEMTITDTDKNNAILWSKKFVQGRGGNYAFNVTEDLSAKNTSITVDES